MLKVTCRCDVCGDNVEEELLARPCWSPPPEVEHICCGCVSRMEWLLSQYIKDERAKWLPKDAEEEI